MVRSYGLRIFRVNVASLNLNTDLEKIVACNPGNPSIHQSVVIQTP